MEHKQQQGPTSFGIQNTTKCTPDERPTNLKSDTYRTLLKYNLLPNICTKLIVKFPFNKHKDTHYK